MTTATKVLLASGAFAAAIGIAYWLSAQEPAGTALLATFSVALLFAAAYVWRANPAGGADPEDRARGSRAEAAGRSLGTFPTSSVWPIALGAGALLLAGGLAYGIWLAAVGAAVVLLALVGLVRE